jgi:O-antigen/teichoic acid export membrane protein
MDAPRQQQEKHQSGDCPVAIHHGGFWLEAAQTSRVVTRAAISRSIRGSPSSLTAGFRIRRAAARGEPCPLNLSNPISKSKTLQARVLSGTFVLLSASGLATAINFAYNIAVARFLGPSAFGHATAVYTLLILISAVTLCFQIVSAKVVAQQSSAEAKSAVYRGFHRSAWACGIIVALFLLMFQKGIASYLNLPSPNLVVLLAVGVAFYVPLGSRRGYIQGAYGFRRLATNLVLEGLVRLGGSLLCIALGFGVPGVVAANAAAIAVAYLAAAPKLAAAIPHPLHIPDAFREALQAIVFFAGQALINNCDIVLVKHFFPSTAAGLYAAVALVGRVIFAFSSAVVNTMFPLVAGTRDEERKDHRVLLTSLLLVFGIGASLALGLRLAPAGIWTAFFGPQFAIVGKYGLPYLLALYAATTVVYSLSVVVIAYEMSYKIANTSWVQLAFSGAVVAGICRFHSSLQQVIWIQFVLMVGLLIVVAVPFLFKSLTGEKQAQTIAPARAIRVIRRVSEDEVVAEFLKTDFSNSAFEEYREGLRGLVLTPHLDDHGENARRRALLFIRHFALWRELPAGTEWFEVEIRAADLPQIRVFPRAQWRKLARGNFSIPGIAERLRTFRSHNVAGAAFLSKITALGDGLRQGADPGAVLLIGLNQSEPLTILDGNHRLVAAILTSPETVRRFRFLCGLSPRMTECCWYRTNVATLFRYGKNLLTHVVHDPDAELARLL